MPKRLTPSELTKLIDANLRTLDPAAAEFSADRQGQTKFREYTINGQPVLVSTPAHDQDATETDFRKKIITVGMSSLSTVENEAMTHQGKTVFIPLAECRNGRQHWVLLVREANGIWSFYDPKAAGWSCGLFSCLNHQLYDTSHLQSMLNTNGINFHYTGIQNLFNSQICGYVVTHLVKCLAQRQSLEDAKKSFKIADYLPKASQVEEEALMGLPTSYGAVVDSAGGLNDDEPKKKSCCAIM